MLDYSNLESLKGKLAVVTGGNKGIGRSISLLLMKYECRVIIIGRDRVASEEFIKLCESQRLDKSLLHFVQMDLDNFDSIKSGVEIISKGFNEVNFLINNAGIGVNSEGDISSLSHHFNGDRVYSTNVMGHYILTELLMPKLSSDARVINMSSIVHFLYTPNVKDFTVSTIYAKSKLANIHHAIILQKRFDGMGGDRMAFSCAPGFIVTKLYSDMRYKIDPITAGIKCAFMKLFGKSTYHGAQIVIHLCKTPKENLVGGSYYNDLDIGISSRYVNDRAMLEKFYNEAESIYQKLISR